MNEWLEVICWLAGFAVLIAVGLYFMVLQFTYSLERSTGQSRLASLQWAFHYHWPTR